MKQFNSYKPSGVEWIGDIPENWDLIKLKYISNLYNGSSLNDNQKELFESSNMDDIPYVSTKDIDFNSQSIEYDNGLRIPKSNTSFKLGKKGSFLLCIEGGSSGKKMGYLEQDVYFVNKLCCFEPKTNSKFQFYYIQTPLFQSQFNQSLSGLIGGVSISLIRNFNSILPPLQEQEQIVKYLDEKTTIIDKLISTKERKIELLKEQRTSLINEVITKGLNPNVKMKDSGVEWIGDIPESWDISKFKYVSEIITGNTPSKTDGGDYYSEDGFLWIKPTYLKGDKYVFDSDEKLTELGKQQTRVIPKDSIMICCIGNTIGKYGMSGQEVSTNQQINSVIPNQEIIKPWFCLYFVDVFTRDLLNRSNFVTLPILTKSDLENVEFIIPSSIQEQQEIVEYLDKHTKEIDDLVSMEQKKIELLKEYRQSLISEVITGKIKVV